MYFIQMIFQFQLLYKKIMCQFYSKKQFEIFSPLFLSLILINICTFYQLIFLQWVPIKLLHMELKYTWEDDDLKTQIKRRKYKDTFFSSVFPSDKIRDERFQSSEEISTFLLKDALEMGLCEWKFFQKAVIDKGDYLKIIYSCKKQFCNATLIYHQKKNTLTKQIIPTQNILKKFYLSQVKIINKHQHVFRLTPKITSEQNIRQYLFDLPVEEKIENHVKVIKQKFKLTNCQARYLKDRIFWKFKDQDHMLKKLTQRKVIFRRKIENGKTTILLLVSQSMKKSYTKFGQILCFDITYKLLKKKRLQAKHLGVGFFVGQDENSRIVLFAVSTIEHQTSENFQILFEYFFEIVEHVPQTIITDDQRAIGSALSKLKEIRKYKFVHLLDWFHKIKALQRTLRREPYFLQLMTLFNRLLKEPSKEIYFDICLEIADLIENKDIMIDFIKEQDKYSLCQVPQKFFSFGIASSRAQSFNNLIKKSVPHQTIIGRLLFFVLRVQKRLLNRMSVLNYINKELIEGIRDQQVLMLSNNLQHLAFEQIRQYYEQSQNFEQIVDKSPIQKQIPYEKYERLYKFNLKYDIKYDCWRCECKNNFRTGMPCSHLFRIIREYKGCISYYINQRWFHDKHNAFTKVASRPNIRNKRI